MAPTTNSSERQIPTRRMSFDESLRGLPRHFAADGDLIGSHVVAALSGVFPDGEDFFVRSVRHFRDRIDDPNLKRQVGGFIGQEAMHGREHRVLNERLSELGYLTKRVEKFTKAGLALRTRALSAKSNLAATAALEHFTATLAQLLLSSDEVRRMMGNEEVRNMFAWHALEESEHKAVAFDVYKAVGGGERIRVWTMNLICFGFVVGMTVQLLLSLATDPATYNPRRLYRSWRLFRRSPVMKIEVWRQLRDYNRPDFHPDDNDTTELIKKWREELFGASGSLNDKLVTKSVA